MPRCLYAIILVLGVSGCHVQLVSDYDDDFVKAAASTQNEISTLLQNLQNPPSGYDVTYKGNIPNYNKIEVDLSGLDVLANSHQNNEPSIKQIESVVDMVHRLEKLHQAGPISKAYLEQKQKDINSAFSFVIRTENDKKAGK